MASMKCCSKQSLASSRFFCVHVMRAKETVALMSLLAATAKQMLTLAIDIFV